MNSKRYLTVTALTRYIKRRFDTDPHLQEVWMKGEISNFKWHSRGHMYFTVKDENSRIQSVMFSGHNRMMKFQPENGMNVIIRGEVSVYEPHGQYQLYVKEMHPDGIGNLYLAYEELKKKLDHEGLFLEMHKKPLPSYPNKIAVITSPTGAAIRDILSTIERRYPSARVIVFPVLVQGPNAASSISEAIRKANGISDFDLMIIGRGGGSIEELWAFNEEVVARAIFESNIPIISAVGHETDYTIADFVADVRAPTPTGAAEMAVPHIEEIKERLKQRQMRIKRAMNEKFISEKEKLKNMQKSYAFRYPQKLLTQKEQQLDRLLDTLIRQQKSHTERKSEQLAHLKKRLMQQHPYLQVKEARLKQKQATHHLNKEMNKKLKESQVHFQHVLSKLDVLSPLKIMERGYSLVYDSNQETLVKTVTQVQPGDSVKVQLQDGRLECQVWGIEEREVNE